MNEMISTFLSGPAFASLLNSALTLAIGLAVWWLRKKTSSVQILNDNWSYVEPIVSTALEGARKAAAAGTWNSAVLQDLTVKGLATLGDKFRLHENAEPPEVLLSAAAKDIEATLKRVVGEFLEASK